MTPKDKAKELVNKMLNIDSDLEIFDRFIIAEFYAQRAALIAVDEIIKYLEVDGFQLEIEYWQQVKQEIKKI